jgi:hypothetical protein
VSFLSLYLNYDTKRIAEREDVKILGGSIQQDGTFLLINTGNPKFPIILPTRWDFVVANNGPKNVSLLSYELKQMHDGSSDWFTGLDRGIFDSNNSRVEFPLVIDAGKSVRFAVEIGVPVDPKAHALVSKHEGEPFRTIQEALRYLAKNHTDLFGNSVEPVLDGERVTGFSVKPSSIEPVFILRFESTRGGKFWDAVFWYRVPKF